MKKRKLLIILILASFIFSLYGCVGYLYEYEDKATGNLAIGYSDVLNDAFVSFYTWNGNEETMKIHIPDKWRGQPVTTFGGVLGKGSPCCFCINFSDEAEELLYPEAENWYGSFKDEKYASNPNYEIEYLNFDLHIGKNAETIFDLDLERFIVGEYEKDGEKYGKVYIPLINVTCDEENKTFYAENGKLYYKSTKELVAKILYKDFILTNSTI